MMIKESLIAALSVTAVLGFVQPAMANTSPINLDNVFEQSSSPLQIATLSKQEMQDTKGAFGHIAIGAAMGVGGYAVSSTFIHHTPVTWKGAAYAAGVGAATAAGGGALMAAAGGGRAAFAAWGPGTFAFGQGVQQGNPAFRPQPPR